MSGLSKEQEVRKTQVKEFFELDKKLPQDIENMRVNNIGGLSEALLAIIALHITKDVADYISRDQAILIWRVVETLRYKTFYNHNTNKEAHRCVGGPLDGQYIMCKNNCFVVVNARNQYSLVRYSLSNDIDNNPVWITGADYQ